MDIGTAKATQEEQAIAPHHLIDILTPERRYSAGAFRGDAAEALHRIRSQGRIPVVVGGSGLYIKALCEGLFAPPADADEDLRSSVEDEVRQRGAEALWKELLHADPDLADIYPDRNPVRLVRALAFVRATGERLSEAWQKYTKPPAIRPIYIGFSFESGTFEQRIAQRSRWMLERGLIDETARLLALGYGAELSSMQTIGYKECTAHLAGELPYEALEQVITLSTRQYAKRQRTWFRGTDFAVLLDGADDSSRQASIVDTLLDRHLAQ
jgi:tRNA dimethylallyltransferase